MTAREFEALLEKRGVPNPPVHQLTALFEVARYAAQAPGAAVALKAWLAMRTVPSADLAMIGIGMASTSCWRYAAVS